MSLCHFVTFSWSKPQGEGLQNQEKCKHFSVKYQPTLSAAADRIWKEIYAERIARRGQEGAANRDKVTK